MSNDLAKLVTLYDDDGVLRCEVAVMSREDERELCHLARQLHQDGSITTSRVLLVRRGLEVEELYLSPEDLTAFSGEAARAEKRLFERGAS